MFSVRNNGVLSSVDLLAKQSKASRLDALKDASVGKIQSGNKYTSNADMGELSIRQQNLEASRLRLEKGQIGAKNLDLKCKTADLALDNLLTAINDLQTDIKSYNSNPRDRAPAVLAGIKNVLSLTQSTLNATYDNGTYIFGSGDKSPINCNVAVTTNYGTDKVPSSVYVSDYGQDLNKIIDGSNMPVNTYLDPSDFKNLIAGLHQLKTALTVDNPANLPQKLPEEALGYFDSGITDIQNLRAVTVNIMSHQAEAAIEANSAAIQRNALEMEEFQENVVDLFSRIKESEQQREIIDTLQAMMLRAPNFATLYSRG
jgi:hypothetical protein